MTFHKYTVQLQDKLTRMGYRVGSIDGVAGPKTEKALRAFLVVNGNKFRTFAGPVLTVAGHARAAYRKHVEKAVIRPESPWFAHAVNQLGVSEYAGDEHNPTILGWFEKIASPWFVTDETPWCAAFVGAMLEDAGIDSTKSARARSYENWGDECGELPGSIAVLSRGNNPKQGHVGFVVAVDEADGMICLLGGNQGDAVSMDWFPLRRVVTCRWPTGCARPENVVSMSATGDEPTTD